MWHLIFKIISLNDGLFELWRNGGTRSRFIVTGTIKNETREPEFLMEAVAELHIYNVHVSIRTGARSNGRRWRNQEWLEKHNEFEVLAWPPNSTDLNPIKHLLNVLVKQARSIEAPPPNLQDLKDLLGTAWCQIPQRTIRGLVESMPQWL